MGGNHLKSDNTWLLLDFAVKLPGCVNSHLGCINGLRKCCFHHVGGFIFGIEDSLGFEKLFAASWFTGGHG